MRSRSGVPGALDLGEHALAPYQYISVSPFLAASVKRCSADT